MNVTGSATTDALLKFVVQGLNGNLIDDLSIFFNGSFTAPGGTSFTETYCTMSWPPKTRQLVKVEPCP